MRSRGQGAKAAFCSQDCYPVLLPDSLNPAPRCHQLCSQAPHRPLCTEDARGSLGSQPPFKGLPLWCLETCHHHLSGLSQHTLAVHTCVSLPSVVSSSSTLRLTLKAIPSRKPPLTVPCLPTPTTLHSSLLSLVVLTVWASINSRKFVRNTDCQPSTSNLLNP